MGCGAWDECFASCPSDTPDRRVCDESGAEYGFDGVLSSAPAAFGSCPEAVSTARPRACGSGGRPRVGEVAMRSRRSLAMDAHRCRAFASRRACRRGVAAGPRGWRRAPRRAGRGGCAPGRVGVADNGSKRSAPVVRASSRRRAGAPWWRGERQRRRRPEALRALRADPESLNCGRKRASSQVVAQSGDGHRRDRNNRNSNNERASSSNRSRSSGSNNRGKWLAGVLEGRSGIVSRPTWFATWRRCASRPAPTSFGWLRRSRGRWRLNSSSPFAPL